MHPPELNKTIANQNQKIADQDKKVADQDQKIVMLENILNFNIANIDRRNIRLERIVDNLQLSQSTTINKELQEVDRHQQQKIAEIEGRLNKSFGSNEVILHDVVNKQNQYAATYTNQIRTLNLGADGMSKQFQYLALSVEDAEKMTTLLNASFNRRCIILKAVTIITQQN